MKTAISNSSMMCDTGMSQILCKSCGEIIQGSRRDARYCSAKCRKRAERQSKKPETEEELLERLSSSILSKCHEMGANPKHLIVRLQFEMLKQEMSRWDKQMKQSFMVMVMDLVLGGEADRSGSSESRSGADEPHH